MMVGRALCVALVFCAADAGDDEVARAIQILEKNIELRRANCPEPPCADDDAAELAQLGWLYEKQGRLKRAVKQFVAATAIDPALAKRTHHALATRRGDAGDFVGAAESLDRYLAFEPDDAAAHFHAAAAHHAVYSSAVGGVSGAAFKEAGRRARADSPRSSPVSGAGLEARLARAPSRRRATRPPSSRRARRRRSTSRARSSARARASRCSPTFRTRGPSSTRRSASRRGRRRPRASRRSTGNGAASSERRW